MSGAVPPADGVVPNSALSFVAPAQPAMQSSAPAQTASGTEGIQGASGGEQMNQAEKLVPVGLKALYEECHKVYPDQPNPLQVTTRLKYWLGGQDPLDYISMYWNPGKPDENIPPHWHYISFGLSDLHGDGRVHPPPEPAPAGGAPPPSGRGFELTLRLYAERQPPLWPAALLQALASYVFLTGNKFCAGDHISWHAPLDGSTDGGCRVRHLLVAEDPQLGTVATPHGTVAFLQLVGCTGRELRAAQRGSGFEVLKLISEDPNCGGPWLVTRVRRRQSARRVRSRPARARHPPAPLAGVSARLRWAPWSPSPAPGSTEASSQSPLPPGVERQIKDTLQRGLSSISVDRTQPEGHMSTDSFEMSSIERALPYMPELMQGSWRSEDSIEYLNGVELILNAEGASLLPLAIDGRIRHGRHFTWRDGARAVTALSPAVAGAAATVAQPYAARGDWLQILIPKDLAEDMSEKVSVLSRLADTDSEPDSDEDSSSDVPPAVTLPYTLCWPKYSLKITVISDNDIIL